MPAEIVSWVQLLIRLGLAVFEAVQKGDTGRTVGEIFAGHAEDADTVERLRKAARERYGVG
jgi:hypothetical protein